jgi:Flp pilus assembly pilin Flp
MEKAKDLCKRFICEEDGMGTVEIVIIIAVLVSVALIFKGRISQFVTDLMDQFFDAGKVDIQYSSGSGSGGSSGSGAGGNGQG